MKCWNFCSAKLNLASLLVSLLGIAVIVTIVSFTAQATKRKNPDSVLLIVHKIVPVEKPKPPQLDP